MEIGVYLGSLTWFAYSILWQMARFSFQKTRAGIEPALVLRQSEQHQYQSIYYTGADAEYNNRPRDDKHLCGCSGDESLGFKF